MNKKVIGIILLVAGVVLLGWGYNVSQSVSSQFSEVFSGSPSDKAVYLYIAGAVCSALGIFQILASR